ncbi:sulfatase-like hydrolase/transferase [Persicobacter diffluens]|uniref:Sulfatase N-terminal domain-containing protein n=1 Tax=Persicobacter diffluens TaxID=981 RepID=A0AAN5AK50_9BACT|nr:hypothetical protein PEDI_29920 [Persicobacter diffluens]
MNIFRKLSLLLILFSIGGKLAWAQKQPNVLWILTDDQRFDSIEAFNKMLTGKKESKLGYVESPQVDRLTEMGTTFINTYCQAQACAPSRASMHYGRYTFRSGIYEFEYHNNNAEHCRPTLPEQMVDLGYQTMHVGKLGVRVKTVENGKVKPHKIYQTDIDFRVTQDQGLTDWGKNWRREVDGEKLEEPRALEFLVEADGTVIYMDEKLEQDKPAYEGTMEKMAEKYDLLRHYVPRNGGTFQKKMVLSGVSSQPAGKTRDGFYASVFVDYLKNADQEFKVGQQSYEGVDSSKPLFAHIGFDFPHTPVLPPADYRERFQKKKYRIPSFDKSEFDNMPAQLKKQVKAGYSDHFTEEEKQKMVQDYYAFCAYGDDLIGQAADAFIDYSEQNQQEWMIVFVCGDHGWKLNEHGAVSKFSSWKVDAHNPIVVVSSDKKAYPAGKVVRDFTEFVDVAPTVLAAGGADLNAAKYDYLDGLNLAEVAASEVATRDYVIAESHSVTGPRAFIRTKDYVFSMQTRPHKKRGQDMEWALNASYKDLDPALYHMPSDPEEVNNLAFSKAHQEVAEKFKEKLISIIFGDQRVEVDWGKKADGTKVYRSNFAPGSHDRKLTL